MQRSLIFVIAITFAVSACSEQPRYTEPASDPTVPAEETSEETTPESAEEGNPVQPDDPETWAQVNWCQPQPMAYDTAQIPSLAPEVALEGFCDVADVAGRPDGEPTHRFVLDTASSVLERTVVSAEIPGASESTFAFDDRGRVRHITAFGSTGFYGAGFGQSWYDLDEQGEMLHKVAAELPYEDAPEEAWLVLEKRQDWIGFRLQSRDERDGIDGPVIRQWTWHWDGDRLVEASLTDTTDPDRSRTWRATWTYHDTGAPASVERSVDGVVVSHQTWAFVDGTLMARTYEASSPEALAEVHGGRPADWVMIDGLDNFQPQNRDAYNEDPWVDAVPRVHGDCVMLPRGPGHGYPDAEAEYQLGVSRDERPSGIGFAYGNDSYGWYYGDLAWYGHDGLGSGWVQAPFGASPDHLSVTVEYNANGRMVSEAAVVDQEGHAIVADRLRTFDDGGGLTTDRLTLTASDEQVTARTLTFTRDDGGHLLARALEDEDAGLLQQQSWERDARGRATRHTVAAPTESDRDALASPFAGFGLQPFGETSWTWTYEGDLLLSREGGADGMRQIMTYDDEGRMLSVDGTFEALDSTPAQTWTYDDEGRTTQHCQNYGGDVTNCVNTVFDAAGRVAWRLQSRTDNQDYVIELNSYTCQ